MMLRFILCILIGYLCGCFSTGYLVGKLFLHQDIRKEGSGNVGSTNALRTMGLKGGLLTFAGDVLKAVLPLSILRSGFSYLDPWQIYALVMGLGIVLGHNFPFWLGFRGGKGIATTAGVILMLADIRIVLIGLAVFIVVVAVTRYVSLGSLIVAWYLPLNTLLFWRDSEYFVRMMIVSLCFTLLAYIRHWENIGRLLHGKERKLGKSEKEESKA